MRISTYLAVGLTVFSLISACGNNDHPNEDTSSPGNNPGGAGGSGGNAPIAGNNPGGSGGSSPNEPDISARTSAVNQTVNSNSRCTKLTPFYWEIGDKTSRLVSGTGGDNSAQPPTAEKIMAIASASKWIFSAWVLEKTSGKLTEEQIAKLQFTSGYNNLNTASCLSGVDTVNDCLNKGKNGTKTESDQGHFYYNGGHMQKLAADLNLGDDYINSPANASKSPKLNADIAKGIPALKGQTLSFLYTNPSPAGGAATSANVYGGFLRSILSGELLLHDFLGTHPVCAWTNQQDCDARYSPVNESAKGTENDVGNEKWHYSLGHWVEDDPTEGDGAFSSPGAGGFYPWIDASKTWYGILARFQMQTKTEDPVGVDSVYCGRLLRRAWITGSPQL